MKYIRWLLCLTAVCFLAACTAKEASTFDEAAFLEEIKPHVACLNQCELELFGAEVDFDKEYLGVYESEAAYDDGRGKVVKLYLPEEENSVAGYYLDPTISSYYKVSNFQTNAEVREYLRQYLSDDVIDGVFRDDFLEYENGLYLRRGSRGYGAVTIDPDSLKFVERKDDKYYVAVDYLLFEKYDKTVTLVFEQKEDGWIMTDKIEAEA